MEVKLLTSFLTYMGYFFLITFGYVRDLVSRVSCAFFASLPPCAHEQLESR